jgi:hypothetical protein
VAEGDGIIEGRKFQVILNGMRYVYQRVRYTAVQVRIDINLYRYLGDKIMHWWDIVFSVGDIDKLEQLQEQLPSRFDMVLVKPEYRGGGLLSSVAENNDGKAAVDAMVASYPGLFFTGVMTYSTVAQDGGFARPFCGRDGETEWRRYWLLQTNR